MDHLLLHCLATFYLWCFVFQYFGIHWVLPSMVTDILFSWWNCFGKHSSGVWKLVPLCLMWTVAGT
jgi:hypothetical protein